MKITHSAFFEEHSEDDHLKPRILKKVPLTLGEWEVLGGKNLWYDKKRKLVYFLGLAQSPLEKHLYVFSLINPDQKRLLTQPGSSNIIDFNDVSAELYKAKNPLLTIQILGLHNADQNTLANK